MFSAGYGRFTEGIVDRSNVRDLLARTMVEGPPECMVIGNRQLKLGSRTQLARHVGLLRRADPWRENEQLNRALDIVRKSSSTVNRNLETNSVRLKVQFRDYRPLGQNRSIAAQRENLGRHICGWPVTRPSGPLAAQRIASANSGIRQDTADSTRPLIYHASCFSSSWTIPLKAIFESKTNPRSQFEMTGQGVRAHREVSKTEQ